MTLPLKTVFALAIAGATLAATPALAGPAVTVPQFVQ